jgi:phage shock protein E
MIDWRNNWVKAGIGLGALAGYLYASQIGCESGGCAITSSPLISTLYFGFLGGLLFSMFVKKQPKEKETQE